MFTKYAFIALGLVLAAPAFSADLVCKELPASGKKSRQDAVVTISINHHGDNKKKATVDMDASSLWKKEARMGKAKDCEQKFDNGKEILNCADTHDSGTSYIVEISYDLFMGVNRAGVGTMDWDSDTGAASEDNPGSIGRNFEMTCKYE